MLLLMNTSTGWYCLWIPVPDVIVCEYQYRMFLFINTSTEYYYLWIPVPVVTVYEYQYRLLLFMFTWRICRESDRNQWLPQWRRMGWHIRRILSDRGGGLIPLQLHSTGVFRDQGSELTHSTGVFRDQGGGLAHSTVVFRDQGGGLAHSTGVSRGEGLG